MNTFAKQVIRMRAPYAIRTLLNESVPAKEKKVGIIGMGKVGTVVAKNLLRQSYKLQSIIDVELDKCEGYECTVAKSPRQVVEECDIIVSALPKPVHIKKAFEGDDGILAGMSPGNKKYHTLYSQNKGIVC